MCVELYCRTGIRVAPSIPRLVANLLAYVLYTYCRWLGRQRDKTFRNKSARVRGIAGDNTPATLLDTCNSIHVRAEPNNHNVRPPLFTAGCKAYEVYIGYRTHVTGYTWPSKHKELGQAAGRRSIMCGVSFVRTPLRRSCTRAA